MPPRLQKLGRDVDQLLEIHAKMLMAGCNPAWCAAQLGQSKEMFFRVYADWIVADDSGTKLAKVDGGIRPVFVHGGTAHQVAEG